MAKDNLVLYILSGVGAGFALGAANYSKRTNDLLERIVQEQHILQTKNVLGDSLPDKFLVVKGDTLYLQVDGRSINYLIQTR